MIVYLAGPLFSTAQRAFNQALATEIRRVAPLITVILPQDRADAFLGRPDQNTLIFHDCIRGIEEAGVVVAILDGEDVDSGTAVEMGYALSIGRPILGLRTDLRGSEERGVNLMVAFACTELVVEVFASVASCAERIVTFCGAHVTMARGGAAAPLPAA